MDKFFEAAALASEVLNSLIRVKEQYPQLRESGDFVESQIKLSKICVNILEGINQMHEKEDKQWRADMNRLDKEMEALRWIACN